MFGNFSATSLVITLISPHVLAFLLSHMHELVTSAPVDTHGLDTACDNTCLARCHEIDPICSRGCSSSTQIPSAFLRFHWRILQRDNEALSWTLSREIYIDFDRDHGDQNLTKENDNTPQCMVSIDLSNCRGRDRSLLRATNPMWFLLTSLWGHQKKKKKKSNNNTLSGLHKIFYNTYKQSDLVSR